MSANSIYAANGRIRKVFLFDTNNYILEDNMAQRRFEPVLKNYEQLASDLNSLHPGDPIDLYIFFAVNIYGYQTPGWYDKERKIWFIPVNYKVADTSVPTSWTQDVFSLIDGQKIHYLAGENGWQDELARLVRFYSGCNNVIPFSPYCEEGDLLRGINGSFRYAIKSWNEQDGTTRKWVADTYSIPEENIFCIQQSESDQVADRLFFHADMAVTIGGNIGENLELLLIAEPYQERWHDMSEILSDFERRLKEGGRKNGRIKFEIVHLPLIVINDDKWDISHSLSYNNCLVENYKDKDGHHFLNFYFPDFREEFNAINDHFASEHNLINNELYAKSKLGSITFKHLKGYDHLLGMVKTSMINEVESEIRSRLNAVLSKIEGLTYSIKFVRHNFRQFAGKRGSLHCIAKVVERDMVNLT